MATIEIGVTHQITISGDNAWVKLSVSDDVPNDMNLDLAIDNLAKKVNEKIIDVIENTVHTVENYTKE